MLWLVAVMVRWMKYSNFRNCDKEYTIVIDCICLYLLFYIIIYLFNGFVLLVEPSLLLYKAIAFAKSFHNYNHLSV